MDKFDKSFAFTLAEVFYPAELSKRTAFTLAEVLITLGIIGVVAALTMPSLINKYQEKVFKTAYRKAYADVNVAFKFLLANDEYVVPEYKYANNLNPTSKDPYGYAQNLKSLAKYFKAVKTCYDDNADECFVLSGECGHGTAECRTNSFAFIDSSGRQWYMYTNDEATFIVDTNGDKEPNKLGKDRFPLAFPVPRLGHKMVINPGFKPNDNYADISVDENGDITTKQRWCPSGNCYYTSWLLN